MKIALRGLCRNRMSAFQGLKQKEKSVVPGGPTPEGGEELSVAELTRHMLGRKGGRDALPSRSKHEEQRTSTLLVLGYGCLWLLTLCVIGTELRTEVEFLRLTLRGLSVISA